MLYVETDDIYEVLEQHKEAFDFSNLKPSSRLYSKDNQKKLGKWKIETGKSLFFFYFTIVKFFGHNCLCALELRCNQKKSDKTVVEL